MAIRDFHTWMNENKKKLDLPAISEGVQLMIRRVKGVVIFATKELGKLLGVVLRVELLVGWSIRVIVFNIPDSEP